MKNSLTLLGMTIVTKPSNPSNPLPSTTMQNANAIHKHFDSFMSWRDLTYLSHCHCHQEKKEKKQYDKVFKSVFAYKITALRSGPQVFSGVCCHTIVAKNSLRAVLRFLSSAAQSRSSPRMIPPSFDHPFSTTPSSKTSVSRPLPSISAASNAPKSIPITIRGEFTQGRESHISNAGPSANASNRPSCLHFPAPLFDAENTDEVNLYSH
jgi:hypothetical protein